MSNQASSTFNCSASNRSSDPEKLYPISFRVTAAEKASIRSRANGRSVSSYLREVAVSDKVTACKADKTIKIDMAARILGALGKSGIMQSLTLLADAAESGSLILDDELEAELRAACAVIIAMRSDLIQALGIKDRA